MNTEALDTAAQMSVLGLDGIRFLETRDYFERNLMIQLGERIAKVRQQWDHNLAVDIANCVGQLFKR